MNVEERLQDVKIVEIVKTVESIEVKTIAENDGWY